MFWYCFFQNTYIWLQWLGFEGKHAMLCIRGFNYQALIRDMLVFQQFLTKSLSNLCFFTIFTIHQFIKSVYFTNHYVHIFGKFHHFPCKKWLQATLLRVFCKISLISPQKSCHAKCVPIFIMFVFYQIIA